MADQPGFWSAEGFPYPLLALGQTFPRGYQYQSQMTPYKRDARGDWGRALNESIDQFFGMWPQYMQQRRQFALQKNQLDRQRLADQHQAKLRPFELRKMKAEEQIRVNRAQMLKDYPTLVDNLKGITEKQRSDLRNLPPKEGLDVVKTLMSQSLKPKKQFFTAEQTGLGKPAVISPDGDIKLLSVDQQLVTLKPGESLAGTNIVNNSQEDIQVNPWTKDIKTPFKEQKKIVSVPTNHPGLSAYPKDMWPFLKLDKTHSEEGILILDPAAKSMPRNLVDADPQDPKLQVFPKEMWPFLKKDMSPGAGGQLVLDDAYSTDMQKKAIAEEAPTKTQKFKAKHEANKFVNIGAYADLAPYAGNNVEAQKSFARINLPEGHTLRQRADLDFAKNLVDVDPEDPRLEGYLPEERKHLKMHKFSRQIVSDPAFKLREKFAAVPDTDTRKKNYPPALRKYLRKSNISNELSFPPSFTPELQKRALALDAPSRSELFKTKHAKSQYANIRALGDLAEVAGNTLNGQRIAAIQLVPEDHEVRQRAQYDLTKAGIKMGKNGVFVPEPFRPGPKGQRRTTASAPQSILVNRGDTLDKIIQSFKAKGITVDKTQVIAANKHFFTEGDPNKMKTSAELGNAEMLIPVGGGQLSEFEVNAAHRSTDPRHNVTIIPGAGTYTNFNNATVPFAYKLNDDLAEMKKMQSNVDEVVGLMKDPNALGLLETGHPARGLIEGLRWRLINNVQVLRDFGVLSSREIETIAKSIPDINSTFNWTARKIFGLEPQRFVEGVLGALKAEGITKANQLRAFMGQYGVQEVDFKIHQYDPYESLGNQVQGQVQDQGSSSKDFVDKFREE